MPFVQHTPESLLRRSDSRNPSTTCKGITSSGAHCRRALAPTPRFAHFRHQDSIDEDGVLAVLEPGEGTEDDGAAAFFCWQHKDQAINLVSSANIPKRVGSVIQLKKRTSVDTMAERLGLLDLDEQQSSKKQRKRQWEKAGPARKERLPRQWQDIEGPLLSVPSRKPTAGSRLESASTKPRKKSSSFALFCCVAVQEKERMPPPRPQKLAEKPSSRPAARASMPPKAQTSHAPHLDEEEASTYIPKPTDYYPAGHACQRPKPHSERLSHTQTLLANIPPSLSPATTSALLAELAKPISPHDEPGYIYIFWLTPSGNSPPDPSAATSFFADDAAASPSHGHRRQSASTAPAAPAADGKGETILLKIGRASNVQRRMNQWTRQCGHDLSLVRFYPYFSTSSIQQQAPSPLPSPNRRPHSHTRPRASLPLSHPSSPSPSSATSSLRDQQPQPQRVPHAHKVERLIHIELADRRVRRDCEACGKEHREWFEIDGTRAGVRDVDAVVRRWVRWSEGKGAGEQGK